MVVLPVIYGRFLLQLLIPLYSRCQIPNGTTGPRHYHPPQSMPDRLTDCLPNRIQPPGLESIFAYLDEITELHDIQTAKPEFQSLLISPKPRSGYCNSSRVRIAEDRLLTSHGYVHDDDDDDFKNGLWQQSRGRALRRGYCCCCCWFWSPRPRLTGRTITVQASRPCQTNPWARSEIERVCGHQGERRGIWRIPEADSMN